MFEITIKEIKTETKTVRGEWSCLSKRLLTDADIDNSAYGKREELRQKLLAGQVVLMNENGYAPDVEQEVETAHEIYTQRVKDLALQNVIKAINGI